MTAILRVREYISYIYVCVMIMWYRFQNIVNQWYAHYQKHYRNQSNNGDNGNNGIADVRASLRRHPDMMHEEFQEVEGLEGEDEEGETEEQEEGNKECGVQTPTETEEKIEEQTEEEAEGCVMMELAVDKKNK